MFGRGMAKMGAVLYVIAILGCGDAQADCREIRVAPQVYADAASCAAATVPVLEGETDAPYPVVMGECRRKSTQVAAKDARTPA